VRKAERARFLSEGEQSEALGINGARPHFLYENALFLTKWGQAPFIRSIYSLGQKQRVFEPYCLSLSFNVASSISKYSCVLTDYFLIMENSVLKTGGERIDKEGSVYYFLGYEHPHHRRRSFINHLDLFFLSVCSLQSSGERKESVLAQQYCFPFFNHHKYYFFSR